MKYEIYIAQNIGLSQQTKVILSCKCMKMKHTEFKGKSNIITWSTTRSNPRAAKSVQTKAGHFSPSFLNFFKTSTLW